MTQITYHGPVFQKLLDAKGITDEIRCKDIDTLLHEWGPNVIKNCITHFIGRKYAGWTSDKKIAFKLTADGETAFNIWFDKPLFDEYGNPKGDFM